MALRERLSRYTDFARFVQAVKLRHPELPDALCRRLARAYGARIEQVIGTGALGAQVAPGLYEAELNYLHEHEWARSAADVLWRRSKLGLHLSAAQRAAVAEWCVAHWAASPSATAAANTERAWN